MEKANLTAILESVRNARNMIEILGADDYPTGGFEDEDIRRMFYDLNRMCMTMTNKIKTLEAETV